MKGETAIQLHDFKASKSAFTFISYGLDAKVAKEAVKVHVLHGRKRTSKQTQFRPEPLGGQSFWWDSRTEASEIHQPSKLAQHEHATNTDEKTGRRAVVGRARRPHVHLHPHFSETPLSVDNQVLFNPFTQRLRDDFGVIGRSQVESTNFLVDCYLNRIAPSRFPRELLACYWHDSVAFKAFLAHAATLYSLETGFIPPIRVESLMYDALQAIRQRLASPTHGNVDGTALAITMLASVEEGRTQYQNAALHWRGLKQLLNARGGLSALRKHRDLHTMLLWREILTSNSTDLCVGHDVHDHCEIQYCSEHILSFFDNFATQVADNDHPAHEDDKVQSFLAEIVNRNIVQHCEWTSSMKKRSEIACLVYLAMLASSARVSADSRRSMERVKDEVIARDRYDPVSEPELLFIILRYASLESEFRCQQLWQISRCTFVTRTLGYKDWKTVRDILSLYVGIQDGCDSRADVIEAWEKLSKRLLIEDGCHVALGEVHATGLEGVPS